MRHLEVSGAVWPLKWSLGVKWLSFRLHVHSTLPTIHIFSYYNGDRIIHYLLFHTQHNFSKMGNVTIPMWKGRKHILMWLRLIESSVLGWLIVTVPAISGCWQWLYQLSVEVLWPTEVGSGCTNCLWRFCDLQKLAVAVRTVCGGWQWLYQLSLEVLWPAEVGSGCTNCLWKFCDLQRLAVAVPTLWRFHDLHRLTVVPTVSGSPVTCRGWQWLYQLSLELLLDSQLTIHAPVLAHGTK